VMLQSEKELSKASQEPAGGHCAAELGVGR
jgi:hypothetical protein